MPFNGTDHSNLKRPAPSSGFSDFPRLGVHASHSETNAAPGPRMIAPSVHNNVFSLAANPNATYPLFCGAYSNNWQQAYSEGMILFTNMQQGANKDRRTTITGRHQSHNILASIPVLNFYLTIGSSQRQFVQRFVKRYQLNEALIPRYPTDKEVLDRLANDIVDAEERAHLVDTMFIEDFNRKWQYMGVILTGKFFTLLLQHTTNHILTTLNFFTPQTWTSPLAFRSSLI
jgi:hypothetical protein